MYLIFLIYLLFNVEQILNTLFFCIIIIKVKTCGYFKFSFVFIVNYFSFITTLYKYKSSTSPCIFNGMFFNLILKYNLGVGRSFTHLIYLIRPRGATNPRHHPHPLTTLLVQVIYKYLEYTIKLY